MTPKQFTQGTLAAGLAIGVIVTGGSAVAHDVWIQPFNFWIAPNSAVMTTLQVGHGEFRQRWNVDASRVLVFRSIGPGRSARDHLGELRSASMDQDRLVRFTEPGTHVLLLQSAPAQSTLPGLRFTAYLKEEGLTPALEVREKAKTQDQPGRETYSRRAKALVQVGPATAAAQPWVTEPAGLSLEIVPEVNPYAAGATEQLPVRVFYKGRPLPGATVMLNNLDFDGRPVATVRTDADGRAVFSPPRIGSWQLNVLWTEPVKGDRRADFNTTFSSLTFGFPRRAAPRG